jgi:16S rRNA G1207 methylase RsmC
MYTREYVNELKSIHEKEKDELLYKYNSLMNNLNRLKTSFSDQILQLQKQIDENNQKNSHVIKITEEECNTKLRGVVGDKDSQIKNLKKQIEEYKECNEELLSKMNWNIKSTREEKNDSLNKLCEMEQMVDDKEAEINNLKNHYENKLLDKQKQTSTIQSDMDR